MFTYNTILFMLKNSKLVRNRSTCRLCGSKKLKLVLNLGYTPLADLFIKNKKVKEKKFPLLVSVCKSCFLVQILNDVDNELLFADNYAFYTGGSPSSLSYFKEYSESVYKRYSKQSNKFILEIASNDGTLLKYFKDKGCNVLGIDPAKNVVEKANKEGIETINDFFNNKTAQEILKTRGKASIIIANNVIAHIINPLDFIQGAKKILDKDGILIIECQYLPYLLFNNQFDNIYHEHRSFFSLTPINYLLNKVDLKIIDVEEHDTQGGSIRIFAAHNRGGMKISDKTKKMIKNEKDMGLLDIDTYIGFSSRVNYIKLKLVDLLKQLKKDGKTIAGYGASAKSNTLLNYCGIGTNYLDYIIDKTPYKFGLYTPGTHIPVVGSEIKRPDFYLLLVWNYSSGILEREKEFVKNGGKFIIPIPTPKII